MLLDPEHLVEGRHRRAGRHWPSATTASTLAYGVAEAGSPTGTPGRCSTSPTGKPLDDELKWVKFTGVAWTHDGKGFFYSRFPEPRDGRRRSRASTVNQKLYYHRLGTPQTDDVLVYDAPDQPEVGLRRRRHRGRPLPRHHHLATAPTSHQIASSTRTCTSRTAMPVDARSTTSTTTTSFVGNDGPMFYFTTDLERAAAAGSSPSTSRNPDARRTGRRSSPQSEGHAAAASTSSATGSSPAT